jgi:hypothetical protein
MFVKRCVTVYLAYLRITKTNKLWDQMTGINVVFAQQFLIGWPNSKSTQKNVWAHPPLL